MYVPLVHVVRIEWPIRAIFSTRVGIDTTPHSVTIGHQRSDSPLELCLTFQKTPSGHYHLTLKLDESLHG